MKNQIMNEHSFINKHPCQMSRKIDKKRLRLNCVKIQIVDRFINGWIGEL